MADTLTPDEGTGKVKSNENAPDGKWKELGYDSEEALIEAVKSIGDLRKDIETKQSEIEKERAAKTKSSEDFAKQSTEVGNLRKKLKELEQVGLRTPPPVNQVEQIEGDDEVLDSITDDEATEFDKVLDAPENDGLGKQVKAGGKKAMAEFVRNYRVEKSKAQPVTSVFSSLRKKKQETVPVSSLAKTVRALFNKENETVKNSLAAVPIGGEPADKPGTKNKPNVYGGVNVDFFRKKQ